MICTTYLYFYFYFVRLNNTYNQIKGGSRFESLLLPLIFFFFNKGVMASKHIWLKLANTKIRKLIDIDLMLRRTSNYIK